jgi:anti-anti-sigma regulatory factor/PAS domain-containing protein
MTTLAAQLAGMERCALPAWVIDADRMRIAWANELAVEIWGASSNADLLARDLSGAPASVIARTQALREKIREYEHAGKTLLEGWTLYPKGVATPVMLQLSEVVLDDGRPAILCQALPNEAASSPDQLRGLEALRHVPVLVAMVDADGTLLMQNPAALSAFGARSTWLDWFENPAEARQLLADAMAGKIVECVHAFHTFGGERIHAVHANPTRDPVDGRTVVLVHHTDETERAQAQRAADREREANAELQRTLAVIEKQRNDIRALSAPVLDVDVRTIALPIIGEIDEARTREIVDRLLQRVVASEAETVILDMTSAVVPDEASVAALVSMVQSIRLLGARPIITGVQPSFASQLADLGFAHAEIAVARTLERGLAIARQRRARTAAG